MNRSMSLKLFLTLVLVLGTILSSCTSSTGSVEVEPAEASEAEPAEASEAEPVEASEAEPADESEAEPADESEAEPVDESEAESADKPEADFKAAFIYASPIGDMGFAFRHNEARQIVEEELGIETAYVENIKEGSPDAERVIRDFAQKGYNAIFACSFGYMDPMLSASQDFPDINFSNLSGHEISDNLGSYLPRLYQARYLTGMVAGLMTETNQLGYVAGVAIPDVIGEINAFTLGARSVNPDAKVRVVWTESWYDPVKETDAANALLEEGADVLTYHANTSSTIKAAAAVGKYAIGYPTDMSKVAPESVLVSTTTLWEAYYADAIKKMMVGEWKGEAIYWGIKEGMVGLAPYNSLVPQSAIDTVEAKRQEFADGSFDVWWGPIYGQNGELSIPDGIKLNDQEIRSIDWFVEGVEGNSPGTPPVAE